MIFNEQYLDSLEHLGFKSFDAVWKYRGGEPVKNIKERSVVRVALQNGKRRECFFLKRHNREFVGLRKLLNLLRPERGLSQGRREFENIRDFRKYKLATVAPVAAGERSVLFLWAESFLITEDSHPYVSLEALLKRQPECLMGPDMRFKRRTLIHEIALFARRMHDQGFNHRDFNATHVLLHFAESDSHVPSIAVFDLQRVDKRKSFRFRWMVKTLANLNYTLPDKVFDPEDRVQLLLSYKGISSLGYWDRFQWFWIERKTLKVRRHTEKIMVRKRLRQKGGVET